MKMYKKRMLSVASKIFAVQAELTKLRNDGIINQQLFLSIYDKMIEGRNYLVGYADSIREEK